MLLRDQAREHKANGAERKLDAGELRRTGRLAGRGYRGPRDIVRVQRVQTSVLTCLPSSSMVVFWRFGW